MLPQKCGGCGCLITLFSFVEGGMWIDRFGQESCPLLGLHFPDVQGMIEELLEIASGGGE